MKLLFQSAVLKGSTLIFPYYAQQRNVVHQATFCVYLPPEAYALTTTGLEMYIRKQFASVVDYIQACWDDGVSSIPQDKIHKIPISADREVYWQGWLMDLDNPI